MKDSGDILASHCDCMAGLGEACSHVAATLFYMEFVYRRKAETPCTSKPCSWNVPASSTSRYKPLYDIDFSSSCSKRKKLNTPTTTGNESAAEVSTKRRQPPSQADIDRLHKILHDSGTKCAVLSIVPKYADEFIPRTHEALPTTLTELYREDALQLDQNTLATLCKTVFDTIEITPEQVCRFLFDSILYPMV